MLKSSIVVMTLSELLVALAIMGITARLPFSSTTKMGVLPMKEIF